MPVIKNKFSSDAEKRTNELFLEFGGRIYRLAYHITGDEELSKDILQDTFIRVFENIGKFRNESSIYTWIYRIAKNASFDRLKKIKTGSLITLESLIETESRADEDSYVQLEKQYYITQIKNGCLLGVLRCLAFNQRIAFILNVIFEVSITDLSQIIGKSENASRILIHRARKIIRKFLCDNCSLYEESNKCRCENMISFSLSKEWIARYNPEIHPGTVEKEIKTLGNEIMIYRSLSVPAYGLHFQKFLKKYIESSDHNIFSRKKVK